MKTCLAKECNRKYESKGYCRTHYMRMRRLGSTELRKRSYKCIKCGSQDLKVVQGHRKPDGLSYYYYTSGLCRSCYWKAYQKPRSEAYKNRSRELARLRSKYPQHIYKMLKGRLRVGMTLEDFINWYTKVDKKCVYCGVQKDQRNRRLSIDRMDSAGIYSIGNMVIACTRCNLVKSNIFTYEQMKEIGNKYFRGRLDNSNVLPDRHLK